jgi:restriction system protein
MLPVLKLASKQELTNKACVELIADQFSLSEEEKNQLLPSGKQTIISNRVHWAITYMTKAGLIDRPKRGTLIATDQGRKISSQSLQRIDNKFLEQFQGFREFQGRSKDKGNPRHYLNWKCPMFLKKLLPPKNK